jgi:TolB-like protein
MKKVLLLILVLLCASPLAAQKTLPDGIADLATQIAAGLEKQNKQRVGITAFTELQGTQTVFGAYLAEAITTRLVNAGVDVVERPLMDKVLTALRVEASGAIDPATAKRVGTQAGVEAIVIGTTTDLKSAIAINARVIDAATGRVIAAAQTLLTRDTMVDSMLGQVLGGAKPVAPDKVAAGDKNDKPKKPVSPSDEDSMSWIAAGTRIVVDGGYRSGNSINLALAFENEADSERTVRPRKYHLIDENGDRYKFTNDSENFVENGVAIPPETRARSTFQFYCYGSCNGTTFTVLDANNSIVLRGLRVSR